MNSFRNLLFAVVAIAAAAGFVLGGPSFQTAHTATAAVSDDRAVTQRADDTNRTNDATGSERSSDWSHGRDGSDANGDEHWRKHGDEFSQDHSAQDYENDASNFVHHPPPGAEIKHRANGDTLIYDPSTNTFAVEDRNGRPRTMFKPDRGEAYWERQH